MELNPKTNKHFTAKEVLSELFSKTEDLVSFKLGMAIHGLVTIYLSLPLDSMSIERLMST